MEGIANNVGGMSYTFPIAKVPSIARPLTLTLTPTLTLTLILSRTRTRTLTKVPSVAEFRKEVGSAKWQVLCIGSLYRRFLGSGGGGGGGGAAWPGASLFSSLAGRVGTFLLHPNPNPNPDPHPHPSPSA